MFQCAHYTAVEEFKPAQIAERILRQLLKQDIFFQIKVPKNANQHEYRNHGLFLYEFVSIKIYLSDRNFSNTTKSCIVEQGKPEDYFVLILEGRVEVTVGHEKLKFEAGPFTCFGILAMGHTSSKTASEDNSNKDENTIDKRPLKTKVHPALARIGSYRVSIGVHIVNYKHMSLLFFYIHKERYSVDPASSFNYRTHDLILLSFAFNNSLRS